MSYTIPKITRRAAIQIGLIQTSWLVDDELRIKLRSLMAVCRIVPTRFWIIFKDQSLRRFWYEEQVEYNDQRVGRFPYHSLVAKIRKKKKSIRQLKIPLQKPKRKKKEEKRLNQ